jgi:hypothetical protein
LPGVAKFTQHGTACEGEASCGAVEVASDPEQGMGTDIGKGGFKEWICLLDL